MMNFEGKWVKLEEIMLSELTQTSKTNVRCSHSFEAPSSKSSHVNKCLRITAETSKVKRGHCRAELVMEL